MSDQVMVSKTSNQAVNDWLVELLQVGKLRAIDVQFAKLIMDLECETSASAQLGVLAAAASAEIGQGNICLLLPQNPSNSQWLTRRLKLNNAQSESLKALLGIEPVQWSELLQQCSVVGNGQSVQATPLVVDEERLYLQRYYHYEQQLATRIFDMATTPLLPKQQIAATEKSLQRLFARDYDLLWRAYQSANVSASTLPKWLVQQLDVVDESGLDWSSISNLFEQATDSNTLAPLEQLVPHNQCLNWQKVAAAVALSKQFSIISGGPGTGKTTTVVKLLAALIEQASLNQQAEITIRLVAPTGKAAARLTESIGGAVGKLPLPTDIAQNIPREASTVHRLLGALPHQPEFRHNRNNPLHLDVLVVDEASMVDLALMVKLFDALPAHARVILLGDKDQLSSVEAGAVLGDLFSFYQQGYSASQQALLANITQYQSLKTIENEQPVADALCWLQKSYRFDANSGVGQLAGAINSGQLSRYRTIEDSDFKDINRTELSESSYHQLFTQIAKEYARYLQPIHQASTQVAESMDEAAMQQWARLRIAEFQTCRLLCALREGEFGVVRANQRIEQHLVRKRLIQNDETWYVGRPIMVTQNDHNLGLFNGDIGLCMMDFSSPEPRLRVYFELPDGSIKAVLPSRVPAHETAFAMTIHKSQGSEFESTYMLLPQEYTPLLTRELVYTGVTRAKHNLYLYASTAVIEQAIRTPTQRASGLARVIERLAQR